MYQVINYSHTQAGKPSVTHYNSVTNLIRAIHEFTVQGRCIIVKEYGYSDEHGITCTAIYDSTEE